MYFVKNAKKTCKQNNRNLNRDGKTHVSIHIECKSFKMKTLIYFLFHHELLINGPFFKIFLKQVIFLFKFFIFIQISFYRSILYYCDVSTMQLHQVRDLPVKIQIIEVNIRLQIYSKATFCGNRKRITELLNK